MGPDGEGEKRNVSVRSEYPKSFTDLFSTGGGPHTVSISADEKSIETTVDPGGTPYDRFTFTISRSEITFQERYRPTSHLVVSNDLSEAVDLRVEVENTSTRSTVYDVVTVPPGSIEGYRGVFQDESEYNVTVKANGASKSISFLNSSTNNISLSIEKGGLQIGTASD
ncbi:hypothetical protein [Halostagnicola kamekurae]|uniref:hypothetical protein n=1 Tax=Halostagnicola kamekurae TaxID=619731 RepID=UPI0011135C6C|nr:hypothetical protein [Halostagnicola kamekurae]